MRKDFLYAAFIFAAALVWSAWFWPEFVFADPDTWYHVFLTERLAQGIPREFPWLPFTALGKVFMDHHLLYHAALYPFIKFLGSFAGIKIATQVFFAAGIAVFFAFTRSIRLRLPILWTVLLALSPSFLFRMHLAKAPSFALLWILLALWAAARGRWLILAVLSFFFVWAYGAWPILPFVIVIWSAVQQFLSSLFYSGGRGGAVIPPPAPPYKGGESRQWAAPLASVAGSVAGLLINPYFPENLHFTWVHNIKIGVLGASQDIGVGAEWYPPSFFEVFGYHSVLFLGFAALFALFVFHAWQRQNSGINADERKFLKQTIAWVILTAVFFVLTLRSRRHIEYLTPFAIIAMAHLFTFCFASVRPAVIYARDWILGWKRIFFGTGLALLFVGGLSLQGVSLLRHREELNSEYPPHHLGAPILWLKENGKDGSFVFHTDWDDFPFYLYGASHLRYTMGLDPLLLAAHDYEKYEKWKELTSGEFFGDAAEEIKHSFGARYIILDDDHRGFSRQLELNKSVVPRFKDKTTSIYEILENS